MSRRVRVAAVQLAAGVDVDENLRTCLRLIERAARAEAALVVLPEFCNHLSWYDDRGALRARRLHPRRPVPLVVAAAAAAHRLHLVVNVTLRRGPAAHHRHQPVVRPERRASRAGRQAGADRPRERLLRARRSPSKMIETPIGRLGLYACMDGRHLRDPACAGALGRADLVQQPQLVRARRGERCTCRCARRRIACSSWPPTRSGR